MRDYPPNRDLGGQRCVGTDGGGLSKAHLAREIGKHPASVRRLLTAPANPELRTVVALADALDADVQVVPRRATRRKSAAA